MTRKSWSKAEDAFLRQHYPTKGRHWVGLRLGRSKGSVSCRANKLGVYGTTYVHWTHDEIETLRAFYPTHGGRYVADLLGRDKKSVMNAAKRYGVQVNVREGTWTEGDLAVLREHYPTEGSRGVSQRTGRTKEAVMSMASRFGIRRCWKTQDPKICAQTKTKPEKAAAPKKPPRLTPAAARPRPIPADIAAKLERFRAASPAERALMIAMAEAR